VLTDPIADMLTRIRNGGRARRATVEMPGSRLKRELARVLRDEGFIADFSAKEEGGKSVLTVRLRYRAGNHPMIQGIQRVSKPSCRVYVGADEVPRVRNGLGISVLSTARGILTDQQARDLRAGGEILAEVW